MNSQAAGVALLRLAAVTAAAISIGLVLATFSTGASTADEEAGLETVQVAVLFFGPIAAIMTLAFIVVLALTRPASMAMLSRRRTARWVAIAYVFLGVVSALALTALPWALIMGIATAMAAGGAWWLLREPSAQAG